MLSVPIKKNVEIGKDALYPDGTNKDDDESDLRSMVCARTDEPGNWILCLTFLRTDRGQVDSSYRPF